MKPKKNSIENYGIKYLTNLQRLVTLFAEDSTVADKRQALSKAGMLNPRPQKVRSPLFKQLPFFDPYDKIQVKYEMLRCHDVDHLSITEAAALFGYTRQAFYLVHEAFQIRGIAGLLDQKRGRRGPLKCTRQVVAFVLKEKLVHPELSGLELADRVRIARGVEVHRRTIERIVAGSRSVRRKKKPPRPP